MRSFFTQTKYAASGALAIASLSACINQTSIQSDYATFRDQCQIYAEGNIGRFMDGEEMEDIRSRNAKLVTLFSDCMFESGWTVATPQRADGQEVAARDDLPELNDVDAGAMAAKAPAKASAPATQPQAVPAQPQAQPIPQLPPTTPLLDPNRRAPVQQYQP